MLSITPFHFIGTSTIAIADFFHKIVTSVKVIGICGAFAHYTIKNSINFVAFPRQNTRRKRMNGCTYSIANRFIFRDIVYVLKSVFSCYLSRMVLSKVMASLGVCINCLAGLCQSCHRSIFICMGVVKIK